MLLGLEAVSSMSKWAVAMTDGKEVFVVADFVHIERNGALVFLKQDSRHSFAPNILRSYAHGSWKTMEWIE